MNSRMMPSRTRVPEALNDKGSALGTWVQMRSPETCEVAARSGFDFVIIDMEHGSFGLDGAVEMIRAVECGGADPVVRLPSDSPADIKKVLDAGARGILVPGIRTAEQVQRVVDAARYEQTGIRGACPSVRANWHGLWNWQDFREWADSNAMVWLLIETTEAVENIEFIASAGADALVLGPFDLSMAMGLDGEMARPEITDALNRVVEAAARNDVDCMAVLFADEPEEIVKSAQHWLEKGCRLISAFTDRWVLGRNYRIVLDQLGAVSDERVRS